MNTEPMTDERVAQFRNQMRLLHRRLRNELSPAYGVSRSALGVLGVIDRQPGITPGGVADDRRMTTSNVAAALREIESAGYCRREKDDEDGRRSRLWITDEGSSVVASFRNERDTWLGRAFDALLDDDERATLLAAGVLMERLAAYEPGWAGAAVHPAAVTS